VIQGICATAEVGEEFEDEIYCDMTAESRKSGRGKDAHC
jgi:hypothetical protein